MFWNFFNRVSNKSVRSSKSRKAQLDAIRSVVESVESRMMLTADPGVVELPSLIVTTTSDVVANDSQTSLREAINYANTLTGNQTITFAPALTSGGPATITLNGTELPVLNDTTGSLKIQGPGSLSLKVDGNSLSRVFEVATGSTAEIDDLTVQKGNVSSTGGGIKSGGTLTLNNLTIVNNQAISGLGDGIGGGIYTTGPLTANNVSIVSNIADFAGGGIYVETGSSLKLNNSTVGSNQAVSTTGTGAYGGGIENFGTARRSRSEGRQGGAGQYCHTRPSEPR